VTVVADEFESYEAIRGAIVKGIVRSQPDVGPESVVEIVSVTGFSFAGTLPPQLREPTGHD
jgi:hypothetical protein